MRSYLKKILKKILFVLARMMLKKYNPKIVGVTGSIGKTSAKEAVFAVLSSKFRTRENIKNYNNEIGLPLTIIGGYSGGRSVWIWLKVFSSAIFSIIFTNKKYPEILVLEMGVDHPNDMEYLASLAPADIGVITHVGPVHLEHFKSIERIAKEKSILISKLKKNGWGVLNADNEYVLNMKDSVKGRFLTFGFGAEAALRALEADISVNDDDEPAGISFKMSYEGKVVPVFLPNILADHQIYAALAGAAVGIIMEMNLVEISQAFKNFAPPKGRLHLLDGVGHSRIIDDTYNASPEATVAAVKTLSKLATKGRKYAVLGDMLELGNYEVDGHRLVGKEIAHSEVDYLIVVGRRAKFIAEAAVSEGFPKNNIMEFDSAYEAGEFLSDRIGKGDVVLVKGSQGMRMEKAVKMLLLDPLLAKQLLVRQDREWLSK